MNHINHALRMAIKALFSTALCLLCVATTSVAQAPSDVIVIPNAAMWKETQTSSRHKPQVFFVAICGEKWRHEWVPAKGRGKTMVFDGKSLGNTWPESPASTPIKMLEKMQSMLRTPGKVEPFEANGKKFVRYLLYANNDQEDVVVDVSAKFPSQSHQIGNSDEHTTYDLIPFDVKAREKEIFDVNDLHQILPDLLKSSQSADESPILTEKKTEP